MLGRGGLRTVLAIRLVLMTVRACERTAEGLLVEMRLAVNARLVVVPELARLISTHVGVASASVL